MLSQGSPEVTVYSRDLQFSLSKTKPLVGDSTISVASASASPSWRSPGARGAGGTSREKQQEDYGQMMGSIVGRLRQDLAETHAREEQELETLLHRTDREQA